MAKAVGGFKREAPDCKEEIVAGIFMEIHENLVREAPEAATPQQPIVQRLQILSDAIINKNANVES